MANARLRHWFSLLLPVLVAGILFRRSFRIWFLADDFAWLGLRFSLFQAKDLVDLLFTPMAQGTVRFLSERAFFLAFPSLFGVESLPMRLWAFGTFALGQMLLVLLLQRRTGSFVPGVCAAIFWSLNFGVTTAISWLSSYNQILLPTLLLGMLYCWDRRWPVAAWACFLAGFGTLESVIVFPALLLAWTWLFDRERWRGTLAFFVPAAAFTALHLFVIPKTTADPSYRMHFDGSVFTTIGIYWQWLLGAVKIRSFGPDWAWLEFPALWVLTPATLGFAAWQGRKGDWLPTFGVLTSLALIGPMLPLRDHRTDYYLASASIGVMMTFGCAVARYRWAGGALLLGLYVFPSFLVQAATFEWYLERTGPLRVLYRGAERAVQLHPKDLVVIDGVPGPVYESAIADDMFRLIDRNRLRLAPGNGPEGGPWQIPPALLRRAFEQDGVTLYRFETIRLRDVTREWGAKQALALPSGLSPVLRAADPLVQDQFLEGWYPVAEGQRWMGRQARVRLAVAAGAKEIFWEAYCPPGLRGARLSVEVGGRSIAVVETAPGAVSGTAALPAERPAGDLVVHLESSKTIRPAGENRDLSLVFGVLGTR